MSAILGSIRHFFQGDGAPFLPELELLVFAAGLLVLEGWKEGPGKYLTKSLALGGIFFSGCTLWILRGQIAVRGDLLGFHALVLADSFFLFFAALLLAGAALLILISFSASSAQGGLSAWHYALLLMACLGMMLMASAVNLFSVFAGLEILCGSLYILTASLHRRQPAVGPLLALVLLRALSSFLFAIGLYLLYRIGNSANLGQVAVALDQRTRDFLLRGIPDRLALPAFLAVEGGFVAKIATLPFLPWTTKNGEEPRRFASAFVVGPIFATGFALLLRLSVAVFGLGGTSRQYIFAGIAVALLVLGSIGFLLRGSGTRMLGYWAVAYMGLLMLGAAAGNENGLAASGSLVFAYVFLILGAFAAVQLVAPVPDGASQSSLRSIFSRTPTLAAFWLLLAAALAGIPATSGFFGRYAIFRALLETHQRALAVILTVAYLPGLLWLFRILRGNREEAAPASQAADISSSQTIVLTVTSFVSLAAGLYPEPFLRLARYAFGF